MDFYGEKKMIKNKTIKLYRPDELTNTQWMDLNIWDYFTVKIDDKTVLFTTHPPYPIDNREGVLWRVRVNINGVLYSECWYANSDTRKDPLRFVTDNITELLQKSIERRKEDA
jgi:hypothetical protein